MCKKLATIFLIVVNIGFFIGGAALLSLGIIAFVKEDLLYEITDVVIGSLSKVIDNINVVANVNIADLIETNAAILLAIGAVLFLLGFLGVCGAKQKNATMLKIYGGLVLVILVVEIGFGVYAYMYTEKFEEKIQSGLKIALYKTYDEGLRQRKVPGLLEASPHIEEHSMDLLQIELQCCGVSNDSEWQLEALAWNNTYTIEFLTGERTVDDVPRPPSCCTLKDTTAKDIGYLNVSVSHFTNLEQCMTTQTNTFYHTTPCYNRIRKLLTDNQKIVIIVFVIIVLVEVVAIIAACFLKDKDD